MGQINSKFSEIGVEITDLIYVFLNTNTTTRAGEKSQEDQIKKINVSKIFSDEDKLDSG
jgi:GTP-dependent phosphoenolpyruvate carboxykinase